MNMIIYEQILIKYCQWKYQNKVKVEDGDGDMDGDGVGFSIKLTKLNF